MRRVLLLLGLLSACGAGDAPAATFPAEPLTSVTSRDGKLQLAVFTAPEQPPSRGNVTARLVITRRPQGTPQDGLTFTVEPEMPSMGHGTPVVPRVSPQGGGTYLVEDVDLFMAGRWDLRITLSGEVTDAAIVPIDVR